MRSVCRWSGRPTTKDDVPGRIGRDLAHGHERVEPGGHRQREFVRVAANRQCQLQTFHPQFLLVGHGGGVLGFGSGEETAPLELVDLAVDDVGDEAGRPPQVLWRGVGQNLDRHARQIVERGHAGTNSNRNAVTARMTRNAEGMPLSA